MASATEAKNKKTISESTLDFLQKNRVGLIAGIIVAAVAVVGVAVVAAVAEGARAKSVSDVEALAERYEAVRVLQDDEKKEEEVASVLASLEALASAGKTPYARARAFSLTAGIRADRKEWEAAEKAWISASEAQPKSYAAPAALYNAAVAAEERGDGAKAIELYTKCAESPSFPLAQRAYFAVGRLNEDRNDYEAAMAAYRKIVAGWPGDGWTKLANSRILLLSATQKK